MLLARFHSSIVEIEPGAWDGLFRADNPFLRHAFLRALEDSGSVCAATGWQPCHLALYRKGAVAAVMPLYLKSHSYGEFVFDWGWAEAYARHGEAYYPKLVSAVPFSPVTGPRLGAAADQDFAEAVRVAWEAIRDFVNRRSLSGFHVLFPDQALRCGLQAFGAGEGLLEREAVQFQWRNKGYACFDDFLATFRASRRKNLKRERRRVAQQGVVLERKTGAEISVEDWAEFYRCYCSTYLKRSGHSGYLTRRFFTHLLETMRDQLMLVVARRDAAVVGSALFLFDRERLYGRYWGALEEVDCLHFETCFYQGIEFCIERGIGTFDPGTQGEHKLMRGFEPVRTYSWHWLTDERFQVALAEFLEREKQGNDDYHDMASGFLPYRRER